jgi:hypothetical protein
MKLVKLGKRGRDTVKHIACGASLASANRTTAKAPSRTYQYTIRDLREI